MAKKSRIEDIATPEVTAEETPVVVVNEVAPEVEERKPSAQTLLEMEAGREALKAHAVSARKEQEG